MRASGLSLFIFLSLLYLAAVGYRNHSENYCTIQYTPRESGFTKEKGFDVTPETRPGLQDHRFPRDFLKAVEVEGFGLLSKPSQQTRYVTFDGSKWGYSETIAGTDFYPLRPKKSCTVSIHSEIPIGSRVKLSSPLIHHTFGERIWTVAEHRAFEKNEIAIYWGEDDPYGPGNDITRPHSAPFSRANDVVINVE